MLMEICQISVNFHFVGMLKAPCLYLIMRCVSVWWSNAAPDACCSLQLLSKRHYMSKASPCRRAAAQHRHYSSVAASGTVASQLPLYSHLMALRSSMHPNTAGS